MSDEQWAAPKWLSAKARDQIIRRRPGRPHPHLDFDPRRTALLIIDMQSGFVDASRYSDVALASAPSIVGNINRLADTLRQSGGTVVWVVSTCPADPNELPFMNAVSREVAEVFCTLFVEGHDAHNLWPALNRCADDLTISKLGFAAFFGSKEQLTNQLKERKIETVLIAGLQTSICCETSAREAHARGFNVIMVEDANVGRIEEETDATFSIILRAVGDVLDTTTLVKRMAASRHS